MGEIDQMEEIEGSGELPLAISHLVGRDKETTRGRPPTVVYLSIFVSPIGPLLLGATDAGIALLEFADGPRLAADLERMGERFGYRFEEGRNAQSDRLRVELGEYFAGERHEFEVPLIARGTDFQRRVWRALQAIPWGETRSYAELARAIGSPRAVRAVAAANGQNPIAIVVPCHRVIGADGRLTGYSGGLERKEWLLRHEGRVGSV